jgi:intracellular septation protein A
MPESLEKMPENTLTPTPKPAPKPTPKPRKESFLANILLNIIIPAVILSKLSSEQYLGTQWAVVVALAFPLGYGIYDFTRTRKVNVFSALGFVSILLTGGISLLHLDPKYIAIKEAAIPGLIGLVTLFSMRTRYPVVKTLLYNDKILKVEKIAAALKLNNAELRFDKVLQNATYLIAASFFLSSILNYVLARILLVSPPGTEAFNAELGKMTALSYPVIALPATLVLFAGLYYLFHHIRLLTNLGFEDVINDGTND